jgi:hypothetical protein
MIFIKKKLYSKILFFFKKKIKIYLLLLKFIIKKKEIKMFKDKDKEPKLQSEQIK